MNPQTAVITGASSGIGKELAKRFAADGYRLILTARRQEVLSAFAAELRQAYGINVSVIAMDLARPDAGRELWRAIDEIASAIDVLVNNAGFGEATAFAEESLEGMEQMLDLNIKTLTTLTRLALPGMIERRHGRIMNLASLVGYQPGGPGMAVYYASKSYVLSFSRSIRDELRGSGVSVTCLSPGATATGFAERAGARSTTMFKTFRPMDAAEVAKAGYKALLAGRAEVIPGLMPKLLALGPKLGPTGIPMAVNRMLLRRSE